MNYHPFSCLIAALLVVGSGSIAHAQIGPDLRPPGLDPNHPIDSISAEGGRGSEWLYTDSWELNASDVVFSASKKRQLISEAPSTIHVITDKQIASFGWRTLAEILRHVPGIQTMMGDSQFQSVMIRGLVGTESNNSRILWLQNGVPFNDVRDSGVWIDDTYPVELIKRIEVVLGPGSALYGSGAFQGVINIFTKDPDDLPEKGDYRLAMGNDMTFKFSAMGGLVNEEKTAGFMVHASGNYTQGPGLIGDYVYETKLMATAGNSVSAAASPTSEHGSVKSIDSNSDKAWYNINLKAFYKKFKASLSFQDIYAGYDGSEVTPYVGYTLDEQISKNKVTDIYNYRFGRREFAAELFYEDSFKDNLSFLSVLSYRLNQYHTENYAGYHFNESDGDNIVKISYDSYPTIASYKFERYPNGENSLAKKITYETNQHKLYGLAQLQWKIYENNELITGLVMEYDHIKAPEFNWGTFDDDNNNVDNKTVLNYVTPSIFLQDEQRLWDNRIILTAGARFDWYKANESYIDKSDSTMLGHPAPSWRAAALFRWTDWFTMRLSYGYSYKEPSLYQLYADQFDYVGNPDLVAETLHNAELSLLFNPTPYLTLRLDGYATFMNNLITIETVSDHERNYLGILDYYKPQQYSGANIFGFEFSANAKLSDAWNLYAHYNFVYSRRVFDDSVIVNLPDEKEETTVDYSNYDLVPGDAPHRFTIGAIYTNDFINADLSMMLVSGTDEINLAFEKDKISYTSHFDAVPIYAVLQPHVSVRLPANFGLMVQGGFVFSEGILDSPSRRYYYEKAGVPVNRYSGMVSVFYPFNK